MTRVPARPRRARVSVERVILHYHGPPTAPAFEPSAPHPPAADGAPNGDRRLISEIPIGMGGTCVKYSRDPDDPVPPMDSLENVKFTPFETSSVEENTFQGILRIPTAEQGVEFGG
jgi:hypothetical protein